MSIPSLKHLVMETYRILPIHENNRLLNSIRSNCVARDSEVIVPGYTCTGSQPCPLIASRISTNQYLAYQSEDEIQKQFCLPMDNHHPDNVNAWLRLQPNR
jgi:hypothetical protein